MGGLFEQHVPNWRNKSWSLTAQLIISDSGAAGVLLNLGGHGGGWSFYLKDTTPTFCYNLFGPSETIIRADREVPTGEHQVRMEFAYDGGLGKGGRVTLYIDGAPSGTGRIENTEPIGFGYEYTDVGKDDLSPVTNDYGSGDGFPFTGTLHWIEMEVGSDSHDHLIDPETVLNAALTRQ
jgi:hypothetical protein